MLGTKSCFLNTSGNTCERIGHCRAGSLHLEWYRIVITGLEIYFSFGAVTKVMEDLGFIFLCSSNVFEVNKTGNFQPKTCSLMI